MQEYPLFNLSENILLLVKDDKESFLSQSHLWVKNKPKQKVTKTLHVVPSPKKFFTYLSWFKVEFELMFLFSVSPQALKYLK